MQSAKNPFEQSLLGRLDVLICLYLDSLPGQVRTSTVAKIRRLRDLGLAPAAIARILGKPTNYVTGALKAGPTRREGE